MRIFIVILFLLSVCCNTPDVILADPPSDRSEKGLKVPPPNVSSPDVEQHPEAAMSHLVLATVRKHQDQYRDAVSEYRETLRLGATGAAIHADLADCLDNLAYAAEANDEYHEAIRLAPTIAIYHIKLGLLLCNQQRMAEAVSEMRQGVRLAPLVAYGHNDLGFALEGAGQIEEAEREDRIAIHLDPKDALAPNNLGNVLADCGKLQEAVSEYQHSIKLDPSFLPAHNNLALALDRLHQHSLAVQQYKDVILRQSLILKATPVAPDARKLLAELHYNYACSLADMGQFSQALIETRLVLRFKPDYGDVHQLIGICLLRTGQYADAVTEFRQACVFDDNNPAAFQGLASALAHLGRNVESKYAAQDVNHLTTLLHLRVKHL